MLPTSQPFQTLFMGKPEEAEKITQLASLLSLEKNQIKLVTDTGFETSIPETVYNLLLTCVLTMANGEAISLVPHHHNLTRQEAADILKISLSNLIRLLEQEEIPHTLVNSTQLISLEDVIKYSTKQDKRKIVLDELIEMTEEFGLYELDEKINSKDAKA